MGSHHARRAAPVGAARADGGRAHLVASHAGDGGAARCGGTQHRHRGDGGGQGGGFEDAGAGGAGPARARSGRLLPRPR